MNVEISSEAEADLLEGYWFYERQSPGLGDHFRGCLIEDVESLSVFGGIHEVVYGFHRSLSKRFPYCIYYRATGETVLIVAVLDARRDPRLTRSRLSPEARPPE